MKKLALAASVITAGVILSTVVPNASAQVKPGPATDTHLATITTTVTPPAGTRTRVLGQPENPTGSNSIAGTTKSGPFQAHAKADAVDQKKGGRARSVVPAEENSDAAAARARLATDPQLSNLKSAQPNTSSIPSSTSVSSSQVYRVGIRDVLDIQLNNNAGRKSTLFTVLDGGMLEYPLAGGPISVGGMTTSEIANVLRQRIRIFDNPNVTVSVRDYASHRVNIAGFVAAPGSKALRREAMPLYTVLAEALVLPEATRATIVRPGRQQIVIDLKDPGQAGTLVLPGDVIKVAGQPDTPTQFFFIAGQINSPGQKSFHEGLTLTQAIFASGGTTANAGSKVRVLRQGVDGRLTTEAYELKKIQDSKAPDPLLQAGDRLEVSSEN